MRIIFMGTPDFARKSLERLIDDGYDIAGVFTQPDKPQGRGLKLTFNPVKELALSRGIRVFQPVMLKNESVLGSLAELKCDLITVVAYGNLLPREILDLPPLGCVNIHGSLLPKYRGAAPIQWAVLNGEIETGVTSMFMANEMDAGDILFCKKTPIGDGETAGDVYDRLGTLGARLLSETISAILAGTAVGTPQNHTEATFAPSLRKDMSLIDWTDTSVRIRNKVRGLNPWPIATANFKGKTFKIFSVDIGERKKEYTPGTIVAADANGLEVASADGTVIVRQLQEPGGKRLSAADYLRGHDL
ncbi:MAG: methionyl-tRNA formyltransferase [Oscillospiraceae bacterium]|nr:methionyl-tRNA formyltransferase [Oscillospiraceae bacterium]